ncbi:hypothetical protein GCM10023116_01460 [Kistimonas scapharcae]|uniref:N-acetyltransferase domain-containing protein n=1 Tax=Kistimonas scapharcae TaxID=1036133 RepID=A0ABP8UX23_9GAMM
MYHPMLDSLYAVTPKAIPIATTLKEKAIAMGYKVTLLTNCSDRSYLPLYMKALPADEPPQPIDPIEELHAEFQELESMRLSERHCSGFILEVTDRSNSDFVGYISCKLTDYPSETGHLKINKLAVLDQYKGKGIGQFLMCCAIDIAIKMNVFKLGLTSDPAAARFYLNKIGMCETEKKFVMQYDHPRLYPTRVKFELSPVLKRFCTLRTDEISYLKSHLF